MVGRKGLPIRKNGDWESSDLSSPCYKGTFVCISRRWKTAGLTWLEGKLCLDGFKAPMESWVVHPFLSAKFHQTFPCAAARDSIAPPNVP